MLNFQYVILLDWFLIQPIKSLILDDPANQHRVFMEACRPRSAGCKKRTIHNFVAASKNAVLLCRFLLEFHGLFLDKFAFKLDLKSREITQTVSSKLGSSYIQLHMDTSSIITQVAKTQGEQEACANGEQVAALNERGKTFWFGSPAISSYQALIFLIKH